LVLLGFVGSVLGALLCFVERFKLVSEGLLFGKEWGVIASASLKKASSSIFFLISEMGDIRSLRIRVSLAGIWWFVLWLEHISPPE
jgi:MFS-type transporter involved in bile tolerance (Atg22 family)